MFGKPDKKAAETAEIKQFVCDCCDPPEQFPTNQALNVHKTCVIKRLKKQSAENDDPKLNNVVINPENQDIDKFLNDQIRLLTKVNVIKALQNPTLPTPSNGHNNGHGDVNLEVVKLMMNDRNKLIDAIQDNKKDIMAALEEAEVPEEQQDMLGQIMSNPEVMKQLMDKFLGAKK